MIAPVLRPGTLDVVRVDRWERLPGPSDYDLAVVLGSDASLAEPPQDWVRRLIDWVAAVDAAGLPILGVCFGAQVLAAALGESVVRLSSPEHAWIELDTRDPARVPAGPRGALALFDAFIDPAHRRAGPTATAGVGR